MTIWPLLARCWQFWRVVGEILLLSKSQWDVGNLSKRFLSFKIAARSISTRSYRHSERAELHGQNSAILARSHQSRRDVENLAVNSTRFLYIFYFFILRNAQSSWRDLRYLGEMEEILPRSHRDSGTHKHHGEIFTIWANSVRSRQAVEEFSAISERWRISRRDLSEIQKLTHITALQCLLYWGSYLLQILLKTLPISSAFQLEGKYDHNKTVMAI